MRLQHPFSMLIAGGRKSGKTVFTQKLLRQANQLIDSSIDRVVWCYGTFQDSLYRDLKSIREDIEYAEGIPVDLQNMFDSNKKNLIILDDMMHECAKDDRVTQLFTRGRHSNLSVILLSQGQYHKNQRTINLNSDYLVIFKNARDCSQIYNLALYSY